MTVIRGFSLRQRAAPRLRGQQSTPGFHVTARIPPEATLRDRHPVSGKAPLQIQGLLVGVRGFEPPASTSRICPQPSDQVLWLCIASRFGRNHAVFRRSPRELPTIPDHAPRTSTWRAASDARVDTRRVVLTPSRVPATCASKLRQESSRQPHSASYRWCRRSDQQMPPSIVSPADTWLHARFATLVLLAHHHPP